MKAIFTPIASIAEWQGASERNGVGEEKQRALLLRRGDAPDQQMQGSAPSLHTLEYSPPWTQLSQGTGIWERTEHRFLPDNEP